MFIDSVVIDGLKEMDERVVPLRPLTFVTGPNGSGKTTVLDAIRLVATGTTVGIPATLAGVESCMGRPNLKLALHWDDGATFAREWRAGGKSRTRVAATGAADGDAAKVRIEERMGARQNLSFSAGAFLEMSGDKRRLAVLRSIVLPGLSRGDLVVRLDEVARAAGGSTRSVTWLLENQTSDPLALALWWHGEVHERALQATSDRKRAEGEWEGVAALAEAVSGQVVASQRSRVAALREVAAQVRERIARDREVLRQFEAVGEDGPSESGEVLEARARAAADAAAARRLATEALLAQYGRASRGALEAETAQRLAAAAAARAKADLDLARGGHCPTCRQAIAAATVDDAEEEERLALGAMGAADGAMKAAREAKRQLEAQVEDARRQESAATLEAQAARVRWERSREAARAREALPEVPPDMGAAERAFAAAGEELRAAEAKLLELERQRAASELRADVERRLDVARSDERYWCAVDDGLGPRGLLGTVLADATGMLVDAMRRVSARPIEVELVDDAGRDTFAVGLRKRGKLVDARSLSGAQRGEVLAATALALEHLRGAPWRAVLADDMDRLDPASLRAFMDRLAEAHAAGALDQAVLAGHYLPPEVRPPWHVVTM